MCCFLKSKEKKLIRKQVLWFDREKKEPNPKSVAVECIDGFWKSKRAKRIHSVMQVKSFTSPHSFPFILQVLSSQVRILHIIFLPFKCSISFPSLLQLGCSHPSSTQNGITQSFLLIRFHSIIRLSSLLYNIYYTHSDRIGVCRNLSMMKIMMTF